MKNFSYQECWGKCKNHITPLKLKSENQSNELAVKRERERENSSETLGYRHIPPINRQRECKGYVKQSKGCA